MLPFFRILINGISRQWAIDSEALLENHHTFKFWAHLEVIGSQGATSRIETQSEHCMLSPHMEILSPVV